MAHDAGRKRGSAPAAKNFHVDSGESHRRVWLVKVPEIVAELVHSSTAVHSDLGAFVTVSASGGQHAGGQAGGSSSGSISGGGVARKRQRVQIKLQLNRDRVTEVLGIDALARTPLRFDMTLEDPIGARIITRNRAHVSSNSAPASSSSSAGAGAGARSRPSAGSSSSTGGFALSGVAVYSGAMKPDLSDPAYTAYVKWRREQDKVSNAATKRVSTLASAEDVAESQTRARVEALALLAAGGPVAKSTASVVTVPHARSVLEAFEKAPVWSLRQLMESTGSAESAVRVDVLAYTDFQRSGLHAGKYTLKAQFRTAKTPPVPSQL